MTFFRTDISADLFLICLFYRSSTGRRVKVKAEEGINVSGKDKCYKLQTFIAVVSLSHASLFRTWLELVHCINYFPRDINKWPMVSKSQLHKRVGFLSHHLFSLRAFEVRWFFRPTEATASPVKVALSRGKERLWSFTPVCGDSCGRSPMWSPRRKAGPRHWTLHAPPCGAPCWCGSAERQGSATP